MVVNSLNFLLFFVIIFIVYYLPICRKTPKFQNTWLFLASYFFYGFADWKMIPLLLGATVVFYGIGLWLKSEMEKGHTKNASNITTFGVVLGVCVLLYFKYLNFFAESFALMLESIGFAVSWSTLNIVLPIGVSFFTFKLISYVIEVHREHIRPCKDLVQFGTYIAFFPTILSGPIDRPNKFLPQLGGARLFSYDLAVDGLMQILWGMFTKMCIADNLASTIDSTWNDISSQDGSKLFWIALLYPIQMYADFDGYSNMAIGVGKLLGIKVTRNFNHPFLARNIAEYWRNWHMSLTGWLTDYVFAPLNIAFRDLGNVGIVFAIIITFVLIGLWHGANMTFALFGLYHGVLYVPLILSGTFGKKKKLKSGVNNLPQLKDFLKMIFTFLLVAFGLILFRADNITNSIDYIGGMLSVFTTQEPIHLMLAGKVLFIVMILYVIEWFFRDKEYAFSFVLKWPSWCIVIFVVLLASSTIILRGDADNEFIYMQF